MLTLEYGVTSEVDRGGVPERLLALLPSALRVGRRLVTSFYKRWGREIKLKSVPKVSTVSAVFYQI